MTVDEIFRLAQQVHALLPSTQIAPGGPESVEMHAPWLWSERLEAALLAGGLDAVGAVVVGDTIASYVGLAWGGRFGNLDPLYEEALSVLNRQAGGTSERWQPREVWALHLLPEGELGAAHIACLLDWWLCREDAGDADDEEPA